MSTRVTDKARQRGVARRRADARRRRNANEDTVVRRLSDLVSSHGRSATLGGLSGLAAGLASGVMAGTPGLLIGGLLGTAIGAAAAAAACDGAEEKRRIDAALDLTGELDEPAGLFPPDLTPLPARASSGTDSALRCQIDHHSGNTPT